MRKIILIILFFALAAGSGGLAQDNIYGDYLLFSADKKISLDLEDAQLLDVLKMLSQQTKLNFISTEAIRQRRLTLYIEEMPLKEALDIIFEANNLAYNYYPDANAFVIKEMGKPTLELKAKVYTLKYARIYFSKLNKEITSMMKASMPGEESEGGEEGEDELKRPGDPIIIMDAVEAVLSEYGRVTADPLTNSLIVVDVPSQFPMIDEVISKLDVPVPKVMIEVEMLDVSKTVLDKLGFDWDSSSAGFTGTYTPIPSSFTPFDHAGHLFKTGTLDFSSFNTVIKFLKDETTTKFLGRPKIITLANETAEVSLTTNEVIGLTVTTDNNDNVKSEPEREFTGTRLRVTPQVDKESGIITLAVDVYNRETVDSGLSSTDFTGNYQNVDERSTKNIVRLNDGDTLFLGGLLSRSESATERKIPFLGDIPILGSVFRYKERPSSSNIDRELLVFITPRVVEDSRASFDKKATVLKREQVDYSKKNAMKVALDSFMR